VTAIDEVWPVRGIRLRAENGELELRPLTEDDLAPLASIIPDDAEPDPRLPDAGLAAATQRAGKVCQSYWRSVGDWRIEEWRLGFVVLRAGQPIGAQELEGESFLVRRCVDSSSWLAKEWRGKGFGKAMRAAVLALAFEGLGAEVAVTEALEANHASLGVSRALGYEPNGETVHDHDGVAARMIHLRLTRERWASIRGDWPVSIEGLRPALPMFGI
jgi:RimJ/RimL family protein N-acetyltransferase